MSEVAQPTNNTPTILNPIVYFRVSGVALAAVALLGLVMNIIDGNYSGTLGFNDTFLNFTFAHDALHVVLAVAAFVFGFAALNPRLVKVFAVIFGVVYAALGIAGFFVFNGPHDHAFLALTPALNAVHLLLGAYALTAGLVTRFD